jgi:ATP-dependent DNA helicase RecG
VSRLRAIEDLQDGFALAQKDLELRGPGEYFGTRQSGMPDLRMAMLSDIQLLELARNEAIALFNRDAGLKLEEHKPLVRELARVWPSSNEWS